MLYISILFSAICMVMCIVSYACMYRVLKEGKRQSAKWKSLFYEQHTLTNKCLDFISRKYVP